MTSGGDDYGSGGPEPHLGPRADSLAEAPERPSDSETGLRFIYSSLSELASRYHLTDVIVVLEGEHSRPQIFRLDHKAVSTSFVAQYGDVPGVYCEPRVVPASELEAVRSACQRALRVQQTQYLETHDPTATAEPALADAAPTIAVWTRAYSTLRVTVARVLERLYEAPRPAPGPRVNLSKLLVAVDAAVLLMTLVGAHGPVRFVLGLVLGLVIPGWAIVGLINFKNAALEVSLTLATSLALLMIAAQIMITLNLWHPVLLEEFTCLVCLPSLLWQSAWRPKRRRHARSTT